MSPMLGSQLLAVAQGGDSSISNLTFALIGIGILAGAALFAAAPLIVASSRGHRQPHALIALAALWAFLTAGSVLYATMTQMRWTAERDLRIKTGWYDPNDQSDAPPLPVGQWAMLSAGYVGLMIWAASRRKR